MRRGVAAPPPLPSSSETASSTSWSSNLTRYIRSAPHEQECNQAGYQPEKRASEDHEYPGRDHHEGVMKVEIHDRCPIT
jgi:hypothetical protein